MMKRIPAAKVKTHQAIGNQGQTRIISFKLCQPQTKLVIPSSKTIPKYATKVQASSFSATFTCSFHWNLSRFDAAWSILLN